jgi:FkbM family methyltransferase
MMIKKKFIKLVKSLGQFFGLNITRYEPFTDFFSQLDLIFKIAEINLIFDIGANRGQFVEGISNAGYCGKIVCFEPLSSVRKDLENLSNRLPNLFLHPQCAVGDSEGLIEFNIAGNSVSSSVLPMLEIHSHLANKSAYTNCETVRLIRLDSVLENYLKYESNLFIKIDTQGYELQVLRGAKVALNQARGVLCELSFVSLYEGQAPWRDIVDLLENEGFVLMALYRGFVDPRNGRYLQMDGIFLRKEFVADSV